MNIKFYCITRWQSTPSTSLLKEACKKKEIQFVTIDPKNFCFSDHIKDIDAPKILYRVTKSEKATTIEKYLTGKNTINFYKEQLKIYQHLGQTLVLQRANVPIPKTIFGFSLDKMILEKEIKYLGGFPIILKTMGQSHGVGVIKIESFATLLPLLDFMNQKNHQTFLREYINTNRSARLIVLGNKVIDSIEYIAKKDDFRSNAGSEPIVNKRIFSKNIEETAIKAVKALGWDFGGVDILIDQKQKLYVTEVNLPCNFSRSQLITKTDIAGKMLDYLIKKMKK